MPTISLRQDLYDTLTPLDIKQPVSDPSYRTLTTLATVMASQWYFDTPIRFKFRLNTVPTSPDIICCAYYSSYPPGFLVPLYFASLVNGAPLAVHQVMNMGLAYHLLLAVLMALFALFLADRAGLKPWQALIPAVTSGAMMLYLPGPLLFLQTAWWPDTAVLIPFLLVVWLECIPRRGWLQLAVLLAGLLTDWLMFPLTGLLLFKRFIYNELHLKDSKSNTKGILAVATLGAALICTYLVAGSGSLRSIFEKFRERSGLDGQNNPLTEITLFWQNAMTTQIAYSGFLLVCLLCVVSSVYVGLRRKNVTMDSIALFIATICLHTIIVNHHSGPHIYSALKLSIPLALAPVFFLSIPSLGARWRLPMAVVSALGCLIYLYSLQPTFKKMWSGNLTLPQETIAQAKFIGRHTKRHEVVFSPNLLIDPLLPYTGDTYSAEAVALTLKVVNRARTIADIKNFISEKRRLLARFKDPNIYAVAVTGRKSDTSDFEYWKKLSSEDAPPVEDENFYYLVVDKRFYLEK